MSDVVTLNKIDLYMQQILAGVIKNEPPVLDYLTKTFVKKIRKYTTPDVKFDVYKGRRTVASFTHREDDPNIRQREKFKTIRTSTAYINEAMSIKPSDLQERMMGDDPYNRKSTTQLKTEIALENMRLINNDISRLIEVIVSEGVFTGKILADGKSIDADIDFGYVAGDNIITLSDDDTWDDPNAEILEHLDEIILDFIQRWGYKPDKLIMAHDVGWAFLKNKQILDYLDKLNAKLGKLRPESTPRGVSVIGEFNLPSADVAMEIYNNWWFDKSKGKEVPVVPPGKILLASTLAECEMHYGMIEDMNHPVAVERYPKVYTVEGGKRTWVNVQTAPMFAMLTPDAFTVINALKSAK